MIIRQLKLSTWFSMVQKPNRLFGREFRTQSCWIGPIGTHQPKMESKTAKFSFYWSTGLRAALIRFSDVTLWSCLNERISLQRLVISAPDDQNRDAVGQNITTTTSISVHLLCYSIALSSGFLHPNKGRFSWKGVSLKAFQLQLFPGFISVNFRLTPPHSERNKAVWRLMSIRAITQGEATKVQTGESGRMLPQNSRKNFFGLNKDETKKSSLTVWMANLTNSSTFGEKTLVWKFTKRCVLWQKKTQMSVTLKTTRHYFIKVWAKRFGSPNSL